MSTANKLTYLNETKQKLKQKINNLGGSIDDNTTFRQYANQLQNVYDNLPKTSYQEGTEINLGVTSKGKLDYENGVVGIGQSEQDSTTGKNKFAIRVSLPRTQNGVTLSRDDNNNIILNGTPTISSGSISFQVASNVILNAGTYTMSIDNKIIGVGVTYSETTPAGVLNLTLADTVNKKTSTISAVNYGNFAINVRYDVGTLTNFIVNPQLESGSSATDYEPYTGGQASPNPSYPQEIKYVRGWNLFNKDKTPENYYIDGSGGKVYVSNNDFINQEYSLRGAVTISFTSRSTESAYVRVCEYNGSTFIRRTLVSASGTYPLSTNCDRVIFSVDNSESVYFTNLQIEEGSTQHPYLPYNTIEEVVSGKNLCESFVGVDTDVAYRGVLRCEFDIKPDTQYAISFKGTNGCKLYTNETLFTNSQYFTIGTSRITLVATTKSTIQNDQHTTDGWLILKNQADTPSGCVFSEIQIEKNSQVTSYEPYITPTSYQLSLGDIELCGIGDYQDYIYKSGDKWYVHKEIGKVVFTGASSESWEFQSTYTGFFTHSYAVATGYSPAKSNYFINSEDTVWVDERFGFNSNGATLWIRDTSNFSSLSDFTTWLATHNLEIYYALATPTDTEITDETLINQLNAWYNAQTLNGTTIITSNGNLPMIIKVRGLKGE